MNNTPNNITALHVMPDIPAEGFIPLDELERRLDEKEIPYAYEYADGDAKESGLSIKISPAFLREPVLVPVLAFVSLNKPMADLLNDKDLLGLFEVLNNGTAEKDNDPRIFDEDD